MQARERTTDDIFLSSSIQGDVSTSWHKMWVQESAPRWGRYQNCFRKHSEAHRYCRLPAPTLNVHWGSSTHHIKSLKPIRCLAQLNKTEIKSPLLSQHNLFTLTDSTIRWFLIFRQCSSSIKGCERFKSFFLHFYFHIYCTDTPWDITSAQNSKQRS